MRRLAFATVAAALLAPATRAADAEPLEAALKGKAPSVVAHLKKKGYGNVGVLKFLVRQGDGPARDDVGDLNRTLANKTQVALCLALKPDDTFGVLNDPSEVVVQEKMTRANHLTEDGRKAFFERKFGLVWSGDKVEPAAFLTGLATLAPDLKRMTIKFQVFDKTGAVGDVPGEIASPADPEELAEAGYSFTLPIARQKALITGVPDAPPAPPVSKKEVVEEMARTADRKPDQPDAPFAPLADCPIKWTVKYGAKKVDVKADRIPEPAAGEAVSFDLHNPGPGTFAVVLMVNGANTLFEERVAPIACKKWVLTPNTTVTVRGFQTDANRVSPFRVLPPEEAEADVVRYGDPAGTFRMVVYHGKLSDGKPGGAAGADLSARRDRDENVIGMVRGSTRALAGQPQTLRDLQNELRGRTKTASAGRGYVGKGATADANETETVTFVPSSAVPISDISLRYFTPKR